MTIHFTLYSVGSIPCKAARTFPCLSLFDGFQIAFRLNFKTLKDANPCIIWFFSLRFHLPFCLPWLTSLWSLASSFNLWKKPSSFSPQGLDSCCSHFLEGSPSSSPSPLFPTILQPSAFKCYFVREASPTRYLPPILPLPPISQSPLLSDFYCS